MNILVVDKNEIVRRQLFWAVRQGNTMHEAAGRDELAATIREVRPDVILLEPFEKNDPDDGVGLSLVEGLLKEKSAPAILIITEPERKEAAALMLHMGVMDVFSKPFDAEELKVVLRRIERQIELRDAAGDAILSLSSSMPAPEPVATVALEDISSLGITGKDPQIMKIMEQLRRLAPTPVSVLIHGETGTGKEVFARAIHQLSERASNRFVALNCAVLSDTLVEDELFGHEKGAFTGAIERRKGKFEYANLGSLFLDEIGELSPRLQSKFLRVLQERCFERLGGNQLIETDFRLISATHRDLQNLVRENLFREDLMYRINVVSINIPPLRERRADIRLLAEHFLGEYGLSFNRPRRQSFAAEVVKFMYDYPWPGNVRELKHFVERAVALTEGAVIGPEIIPGSFTPDISTPTIPAGGGNMESLVKSYKRQLLMETLRTTGNNKLQAAQILGVSRSYLFKMIKQLNVPI
ncbi:MAG: sigma-54 dependent transcriptional regulator [Deltaproteobacteria bacterium]|nr:sigma-54 dependent transcriptional regulator [Deltaproteobacteria bacterium]